MLLDRGPHTVTVFLDEDAEDWRGDVVAGPTSQSVVVEHCWMQPVSSDLASGALSVLQGQDVDVVYRLIARSAPVDWWSRVEWVDEGGVTRKFAPLGGPVKRGFSPATTHITCTLREMR